MGALKQCIETGLHLTDCDDDGFCNHCGYQDNIRNMLLDELIESITVYGDAEVLDELLSKLDDKTIYNALSDESQSEIDNS